MTERLSVGLLYDAIELLDACDQKTVNRSELGGDRSTLTVALLGPVLSLAATCGWITNNRGHIGATGAGAALLGVDDAEYRLRLQLSDYIKATKPTWSPLIPRGANELKQALSVEEAQCFTEAGLFDPEHEGVPEWWSRLAGSIRLHGSENDVRVGREGELLSRAYEKARVGTLPRWVSFESTYAGYDLLSTVSRGQTEDLRIEVKASELEWKDATAHISENEWRVASAPGRHVFHFWLLQPKARLLILHTSDLRRHIPANRGWGRWESTAVPYKAFSPTKWTEPSPKD